MAVGSKAHGRAALTKGEIMKRIALLLTLGLASCNPAWAADKKITDLNLLTSGSFATTDVLPIVDVSANETKKTRILDFDARYIVTPFTTNGDMVYQSAGIPARLAIGASSTVQVSTGTAPSWATLVDANVSASAGIARTKLASGTASHVLINDGSGVMSSEAALAISRGGTNNGSLAVTAGGVVYTDGTKLVNVGAGTSGQVLSSNGASAPSWATAGSTTGPTYQTFTSGSGTYTTPANVRWIKVSMIGGGGGGAGSGTSPGAAGDGVDSTFSTFTANKGIKAVTTGGGAGGSASGGSVHLTGGRGGQGSGASNTDGGQGGSSHFGGNGPGGGIADVGFAAAANSGSGGGGAGDSTTVPSAGGGGAGGYLEGVIINPSASYSYAVGGGGSAGTAGTGGFAGGAGAAGVIIVEEHYNY